MSTLNFPSEFSKEKVQEQHPGAEHEMEFKPIYDSPTYKGSGKLEDKVAIVTGGDSGIGRSVSLLYAREGCDVCIVYLKNHEDAEETKKLVEREGRKCEIIAGDLSERKFCSEVISRTLSTFKKLDILVNHHGVQYWNDDFSTIDDEQMIKTFNTNVLSYMFLIKDALPHLKPGSVIINTSSVTAFKGKKELVDYSATNGAIVSLTRALASQLVSKGIRVNSVAPGPIFTPFVSNSF